MGIPSPRILVCPKYSFRHCSTNASSNVCLSDLLTSPYLATKCQRAISKYHNTHPCYVLYGYTGLIALFVGFRCAQADSDLLNGFLSFNSSSCDDRARGMAVIAVSPLSLPTTNGLPSSGKINELRICPYVTAHCCTRPAHTR